MKSRHSVVGVKYPTLKRKEKRKLVITAENDERNGGVLKQIVKHPEESSGRTD
jgi:hypothetical protein